MNINSIKRRIRKALLGYDVPTYFFSKSGEDAILHNIFYPKLENKALGFYVDVGAYHPQSFSNTFLFYKSGWRGINIDANPFSISAFNKSRKRDININNGVGLKPGSMEFYLLGDEFDSMNSFSYGNLEKLGIENRIENKLDIEIKTLAEILDKNLPNNVEIDFLDVDVEGMDLEVLKSNNWNKYRPNIVMAESDNRMITAVLDDDIYKFMKSIGYELIAKTTLISQIGTLIFERIE